MELKIGIIVNTFNCFSEYCKKRRLKDVYRVIPSTLTASVAPPIVAYRLIVNYAHGELFKSVVASGRTPKIAKENAVYKFLRLVRHHEFEVDIDTFSEQKNILLALNNYVQSMQLQRLQTVTTKFEIPPSDTYCETFRCKCTIPGMSREADAPTRYAAQHRAAFLVLHQIEMNEMKQSMAIQPDAISPETRADPKTTNIITFDGFDSGSYTQVNATGYAVIPINAMDLFYTRKILERVRKFIDDAANKLNCTSDDYLSVINFWRQPCKLVEEMMVWFAPEILHELERFFGCTDFRSTTTYLINMKNVTIDEDWANISNTAYEFRVWTPCYIDDHTKPDLSGQFEIFSDSQDSNSSSAAGNIKHIYQARIGESLILRHNTKFRLSGSTKRDQFYFVSEWRRQSIGLTDIPNNYRFLVVDELDQTNYVLLLGLEKVQRLYCNHPLTLCVDIWLQILATYEQDIELRNHLLLNTYIDTPAAQRSLKSFRIFLQTREEHGHNLTERCLHNKLQVSLLQPIQDFAGRHSVNSKPIAHY